MGSLVPPGNTFWLNRDLEVPAPSAEAARRELEKAGFAVDGDGKLRDAEGRRVELTLITNSSNDQRVHMATIIQDDLRQLGMTVTVVPLEFRALIDRVMSSFDYELCLLGLSDGDADPNPAMDILLSDGSRHFWRLGQKAPATAWQREIDRLMREQLTELDPVARKRLYDRVQEILVEQAPMIPLVSPNVLVGAHARLGGFRPAIREHTTLWNVEELYWLGGDPPSGRSTPPSRER